MPFCTMDNFAQLALGLGDNDTLKSSRHCSLIIHRAQFVNMVHEKTLCITIVNNAL